MKRLNTSSELQFESSGGTNFWPSPQDYNEAIQHSEFAFSDVELRAGVPATDAWGIPRPVSGGFASVYKLEHQGEVHAVRCFLSNVIEQKKRYELIAQFLNKLDSSYFLRAIYQEQGIKVRSGWFPIVKMHWQEGKTMDVFIEDNLYDSEAINKLADDFALLCRFLADHGMAHGDLQHGNIMVTPAGDLKLVDYDGMFVPKMSGWHSQELGHRCYQHPKRSALDFGPALDQFSAYVIYFSLKMLVQDPSLYCRLNADDSLLFRAVDFSEPNTSRTFALLEAHDSAEVRRLAKILRWQCSLTPQQHSFLWELPEEAPELPVVMAAPACDFVVIDEPEELPRQPPFYAHKWWRTFSTYGDLWEGLEPEVLRPGRVISPRWLQESVCLHIVLRTLPAALFCGALLMALGADLTLNLIFSCLVGIWQAGWNTAKQLRLMCYGRPTRARIMRVSVGMFHVKCWVEYAILYDNGFRKTCRSTVQLPVENFGGEFPTEGETLTALYDGISTGRVVLVKYSDFRLQSDPVRQQVQSGGSHADTPSDVEPELKQPVRAELRRRMVPGEWMTEPGVAASCIGGGLVLLCLFLIFFSYFDIGGIESGTFAFSSFLRFIWHWIVVPGFVALVAGGGYWLGQHVLDAKRQRALCQTGSLARARIVEVRGLGLAARVRLEYLWESAGTGEEKNGTIHTGKTSVWLPAHLAAHLSEGEIVTVLYSSTDLERPVIYKLCQYEVI